ncbi:MAG: aldehyde dehydrogenase family protein, partial [Candidatus Micrarchaeota archaeon]|nr:aldehyde dehydrogenase family protein [Candidatus Micrarchaeota archaeon]
MSVLIQSINPANGQINADIALETTEQALEQCRKTHAACGAWRALPLSERCVFMRKLAQTLRANADGHAVLMATEMGKPVSQGKKECEKSAWTAEVYADNAETWLADQHVQADGQKHTIRFEPLGTVLAVMPWNYPFWQLLRVAIPVMLAGNTLVLRHSNNVPLCAQALNQVFKDAGFPADAFGVVITGHDAVKAMVESPHIQGVSLTGSETAGKIVGAQAANALKPMVLELGGSDAFIVLEDADLSKAVDAAVVGRTQNAGQSCIAAKRIIVHEKIADAFTNAFVEKMASLQVGDPLSEKTHVGPLSSLKARDDVKRQVDES